MARTSRTRQILLIPPPVYGDGLETADALNDALRPHGMQLPANPTPAQLETARWIVAMYAGLEADAAARQAEGARIDLLANDPDRKAAYDAARAECFFDTEALFPGWIPQPLTPRQQADADLVANLRRASPPSWAVGDPAIEALRDEANRLFHLKHGRSPQARAIGEEEGRLRELANRLSRQDSRRRRRETPGSWPRLVPWPSTCQVCGRPLDPSVEWPDPLSESLGHEPPIFWVARHPDYDGPRVLRPEHLICNMAKRTRPDWEMPADPQDWYRDAFVTPPTHRATNPDGRGKGSTRGAIPIASVVPATLVPSWPRLPPRRSVGLSTSEINALPFEATACPTCGVDVAKPPKGRKKCTSCGVYMFVIVIDKSRRRLVTEAEMQRHETIQSAGAAKEWDDADREWRSAVNAAGIFMAPSSDWCCVVGVVGESHYQQDLAALMAALGALPNASDIETVALLAREPDNPDDQNAVKVVIHGQLVGYLSPDDAEATQDWLQRQERSGRAVYVMATIGGGRDRGGYLTPIGVTLDNLPEDIFD